MQIEVIYLEDYKTSEKTKSVQRAFEAEYMKRYGYARSKGLYRVDDWKRIDFCLSKLSAIGGTILDVGVGPGGLLNILQKNPDFMAPVGIDIRAYSKLVKLHQDLDIRIMDVSKMTFEDQAFDVVVCMEVLEHLDETLFKNALLQLRRVAKKAVFMTVPLCEPEPLPSYHKQNFNYLDIRSHFSANSEFFVLQPKSGVPWIGILEYQGDSNFLRNRWKVNSQKSGLLNWVKKSLPIKTG
ncbi:class I SAM-dependent methyltransferase [Roseibium aggregatum]|uniref:class I SAM-dependent methyltransferase n=1 Tax=Roseibium aggregatum TaxID=187304 RepID=UPI0025AC4491|nr:class I SAM-dependent methyltransferase [Roseibium aggregatum]WJS01661.1 class I SAM-dependent methyltransferase [Roseibium aggregatum]